jgi:chromosome segregation ATPase
MPEAQQGGHNDDAAAARADAARLIDLLAQAYAVHARNAADAEQRRKELATAVNEIAALTAQVVELRAGNHRLRKERGDLTGEVADLEARLGIFRESNVKMQHELAQAHRELQQARSDIAECTSEAEKRIAALNGELAQITERFLTFVNEAHEDRRHEVQTLSGLIEQAQNGIAWRIKRVLGKLWRK